MCHFHWKWGQLVLFCFCKSWLYYLFYTAWRQLVMLSLCSVTACLVQPCVVTTVSYTIQRRKCLPPVPHLSPATLDMSFCLWKPLQHLPPDRSSITSRYCEKRAQKATPIEKRREEWTDEDKSDRRFSWSTSIRFFQLSNPLSSACRARLLPFQFSSPPSLWRVSTHHFRTTFLSTVTTSQPPRSAFRSLSQTAASHSPWFFSRKHTPCLPLQSKIRRHFQEEVRHMHLHSGQQHRHHAADGDLAAPCRWRGQDRRPGSAWVLGALLSPLRRKRRGASPSS